MTEPRKDIEHVSVYMPQEHYKAIKEISTRKKMSVSEYILTLVNDDIWFEGYLNHGCQDVNSKE